MFVVQDPCVRPPSSVSLGFSLDGAALPHPDCSHDQTVRAGAMVRMACNPPKPNRGILRRLRKFVRSYLRRHFTPLDPASDLTVETWLAKTSYPRWRKIELLRKYNAVTDPLDPKYFRVKSFAKDEPYPEYKHARGINSRTDEFKCFVGPVFKLIEEQVYANKHFIKHVPVRDRPKTISERLYREGAQYIATDYTAFESLFTKEIMAAVEFELYAYMTKELPYHRRFMWYCWNVLAGKNICHFKNFVLRLWATRMSGEMCTSLGNGFANLMFMLFMLDEKGCTGVDGFVEGDDGLFAFEGPVPTELEFQSLGLKIKLVKHRDLCRASFCGLIFDPFDCTNVTNPLEVLATVGWTTNRYALSKDSKLRSLLRCKALSLAHQYPGCPIIQPLAFRLLELTEGAKVGKMIYESPAFNQWERDQLIEAYNNRTKLKPVSIGNNTRLLVAEEFNISLSEQRYIEKLLSNSQLEPLRSQFIESICPNPWLDYFSKYHYIAKLDSDGVVYDSAYYYA